MTDSTKKNDELFTISETSKMCNVSRQAVYIAIKKKRLKAQLISRVWIIAKEDIEIYRASRYNRENSKINGEPVFDIVNGYLSVNHISKLFGLSTQHIYYLLRTGQLHAAKKGSAWVVKFEEVKKIYDEKTTGTNINQLTFA